MTAHTTPPLWTLDEIASALAASDVGCTIERGEEKPITSLDVDSREVTAGSLFVARRGEKLDGHAFLPDVFSRGAACAIVEQAYQRPATPDAAGWTLIRVADPDAALRALGQSARARSTALVIGVTGSAGKTGTKEMLATALAGFGKTHASAKSYNNHVGVPLTLARMPRDTRFAVIEMGMNHAGEISALTAIARPHIAIITTIEPAHIEHFGSIEKIADAKAEIFEGLTARPDGTAPVALLNIDNPLYPRLLAAAARRATINVVSFGEDEDAQARMTDCALHADGTKVEAIILGTPVKLRLSTPGKHIAQNALAVLAAVKLAGCDLARAATALETAQAVQGRGVRLSFTLVQGAAPITVIDESYNANPGSMRAAFETFALTEPTPGGRRIAVLGDMLEQGREGPRLHAELANPLLHAKVDLLFCCGPLMDALYQTLPPDWRGAHASDSKALVPLLLAALKPGDVVLVKGSNGSKLAYIIEALKNAALSPLSPVSKDGPHAA